MRIRVAVLVLLAIVCFACGSTNRHRQAQPRRVPNVVDLSWSAAVDRLAGADLCVQAIQTTSGGPAGTVLRQTPRAGATMKVHGRVSIVVAPSGRSGSVSSYSIRGCQDAVEYVVDPG
jgi:beta-lactam-binding protein with PASTA domain